MSSISPALLLMQVNILDLVRTAKPVPMAVFLTLIFLSVLSWAIVFAKWQTFSRAREMTRNFLRAFRKSPHLEAVAIAAEQYRDAAAIPVFELGYEEFQRQLKSRGQLINRESLQRTLQIGVSEQVSRLEVHLNWLATIATVAPFIGLFGTVWGIIDAFQALSLAGSASLRAVGPGIAEALVATAIGLAAAIPAAVGYNYFGSVLRELSARLDDFSLEFMNAAERQAGG